MNNKNNFSSRHGSPLFSPTDPEKGFDAGGGGQSRRKFLKRTGGATLATAIAWLPTKVDAHPNHEESEEWNMDWVGATSIVGEEAGDDPAAFLGMEEETRLVNLNGFDPGGNPIVRQMKMTIRVHFAPAALPGQSLSDTLEIRCLARFSLIIEFPGAQPLTLLDFEALADVACDPSNGHMGQVVSYPADANGVTGPLIDTTTPPIDGVVYNFSLAGQITSLEDNQFDPVTGKHKFVSVAIGIAKMVRFQNGLPQMNTQILVPVAGGVNVLNTFTSKKLN